MIANRHRPQRILAASAESGFGRVLAGWPNWSRHNGPISRRQ
jgi:hypothetical protein